ncbi:MAG TPA: hypothetical protein P5160_01085 [Candidatus Omnitrophota bacterium]|nr:hypothetical protein [Candidatus Omnitrophota bacterium]
MDQVPLKTLIDLYLPVLICYAVIIGGFQYVRYRRAKGKPQKARPVFVTIMVWISVMAIIAFFVGVAQLARTTSF